MKALKSATIAVARKTPIKAVSPYRWHDRSGLPSTEQLLVEGGDARILLDAARAANKYGCPPFPDTQLAAFGSSTASVISAEGFAAADRLRLRLSLAAASESHAAIYAGELERMRRELTRLCGVSDLSGLDVVFAASGTDIHLIAGQLAGGTEARPALAVMVDAAETGSGVPAALAGRHSSTRTAQGDAALAGALIDGGKAIDVVSVPLRLDDGSPREAESVDTEVESWVSDAAAQGRRVLLVMTDVSKTGMIAPSPACVLALQRRYSEQVDVLVDACQFRIAPATLRAYLEQGFMVAVTGSKFVSGPTFSGALLFPAAARRFRGRTVPRDLSAYCARAEWPRGWAAAESLDNTANFGLLLRWEAALAELRAFRAVPETEVTNFLQTFAEVIRQRLLSDPVFEPLPAPPLDRRPLIEATSWDHIQTIFPFLLFHRGTRAGRVPLSREETLRVYELLQVDLANHPDFERAGVSGAIASLRCQLGQPVACGTHDGMPVSALRLCMSTRLIVEGTAKGGRAATAVIERALAALDKIAWMV